MKIIALDIGGTAVKSGLVDNGVLKEHRETPTPAAEGGWHRHQHRRGGRQ